MIKIAFLISSLRYGGANKVMIDIANFLSKKGYEIIIITYQKQDMFYQLDKNIKIKTIKIDTVISKKMRRVIQIRHIIKLFKILKKENPKVIISFENYAKLISNVAAIFTRTKVIVSERLDPYNYKKGKKYNNYIRHLMANGCVFQTRGAANYFPKKIQQTCEIIPNFSNFEKKDPVKWELRKNEISFVARLDLKQKRQDIMLEAFKLILKEAPYMKLVFYGDGPDKKKLQVYSEELGLSKSVEFRGVVKEIRKEIRNSKVFVLTSDFEGIPNALIEALSLGVPSVSTDCSPGGARELIEHGVNGFIVPCGNVKEIADKVLELLINFDLSNRVAKNAINISDQLSPNKILPKWEEYIKKICCCTENLDKK